MAERIEHPIEHDRLAVPDGVIPKGRAYQWITKSVMGDDQFDLTRAYLRNGWKKVPLSRHKALFQHSADKRFIEVDGLVLMEQSTKYADRWRSKAYRFAKEQADQVEIAKYQGRGGGIRIVDDPAKVSPRSCVSSHQVDPLADWVVPRSGYRRIIVRIKIWIVSRLLGLTECQLARACDGTLVWNAPADMSQLYAPIGPWEMARRVRIMKKRGVLPRQSICEWFKRKART